MMPRETVLRIHALLVEQFGGAAGLRDPGALDSALARPYQTFDGAELLPEAPEKAAATIESILVNHPFVDGNKRTGYVLLRLLLLEAGLDLRASEDDKYDLVIGIAAGTRKFDGILESLRDHLVAAAPGTT